MRFRLELWVNSTGESTKRTYLVDTSARDLWICSAAVGSLGYRLREREKRTSLR